MFCSCLGVRGRESGRTGKASVRVEQGLGRGHGRAERWLNVTRLLYWSLSSEPRSKLELTQQGLGQGVGPVVWCALMVGLVTFAVGTAVPRVCPGTSPQQKGTTRHCA